MIKKCPNCGAEMNDKNICPECGYDSTIAEAEPLKQLEIGSSLVDRYEITELLETQQNAINCYLVLDKESEEEVLIKEAAVIEKEDEKLAESDEKNESNNGVACDAETEETEEEAAMLEAEKESEVQPEEEIEESSESNVRQTSTIPFERLKLEREILKSLNYPTIVKALDYFETNNRAYLVEEYLDGCTLRETWQKKDNTALQKIDWLIQLCQALAKVHTAGVLYNAINPDRLKVSKGNRVVLTDFSSACKLPLPSEHQQGIDLYATPELVLNPEEVDVRADLYSFGVMWYELLLGRALTDDDFEGQFILKTLQDSVKDFLHPSINRIILKLSSRNNDLRFATTDEIASGKQPITSLQRSLLQFKQQLTESSVLAVGSQTNIGLQRENNEDNLWTQNLSYRTAGGHGPLGLFIVADGMGGAEAGEVASKIVVQSVSKALLPQLFALHDKAEEERSESLLEKFKDAILSANSEVYTQAEKKPQYHGMGSTVTLAAVLGNRVYIGHVGDSRLYLVNKEEISQKTVDHTIANRLVQLGTIEPEEAETYPQRDVLFKVVGVQRDLEPDTLTFTIEEGDILILCSDGLTKYIEDAEIHEIVKEAPNPQEACNCLVDLANISGGEDNITVIAVKVVSGDLR